MTNDINNIRFDFFAKKLNIGDNVVFCKNNVLYKATVSHFTKWTVAVMYIDYEGVERCSYIPFSHEKIIKI